jgi:hypothetical protein
MIGKIPKMRLIVLFATLSLASGCKTTKTEVISIPQVPQNIVQRMMTHPQIDKAWEQVPEFTRDALKIISDQAAQLELENIDN